MGGILDLSRGRERWEEGAQMSFMKVETEKNVRVEGGITSDEG